NDELRKIMEHRDKLYSVIAHDLRGPLGSIKMIMECLQTNLQNKNIGFDNMELLSEANKLSDELFQLLDNLLKWTKNQLGRLNLVYQKVDIRGIVLSVVEFYTLIAQFKSIQITTDVPSELFVNTDIDVVKTILRNFINNAIKFSYTNSEIHVGAKQKGDVIEVFVKDFGQGIPEDQQMRLRNREFVSSAFGTNKEEGTGMGLTLSRDLIDRIGGSFDFESEPGKGATFYFSIPVCS
ncbi:MAG: sensor histidine kinase, partial [Bacteroidales bacterium]